jgi:hypothetical protein
MKPKELHNLVFLSVEIRLRENHEGAFDASLGSLLVAFAWRAPNPIVKDGSAATVWISVYPLPVQYPNWRMTSNLHSHPAGTVLMVDRLRDSPFNSKLKELNLQDRPLNSVYPVVISVFGRSANVSICVVFCTASWR